MNADHRLSLTGGSTGGNLCRHPGFKMIKGIYNFIYSDYVLPPMLSVSMGGTDMHLIFPEIIYRSLILFFSILSFQNSITISGKFSIFQTCFIILTILLIRPRDVIQS